MTKEQFLNGTQFYIGAKSYKGACTYCLDSNAECITRQSRSSIDERVVINDYECNVTKVGRLGFEAVTYVMNKRVKVKYKFSDLVEFKEGV